MNRVLIKTAGRTGSHVIAQQEMRRLGVEYLHHVNIDGTAEQMYALDGPCVVHDHTRMIPSDSDRWNLLVSVRRSVYDQAVSYCIANATNNFGDKPAADGDFIVDPDLFMDCLVKFKELNYFWILIAEFFPWQSVRTVYWEDCLPLTDNYTLNYPAADRARVVNHDQLQSLSERRLANHNWAIEAAIRHAQQYIGIIPTNIAREILCGDAYDRGELTAKQLKRLRKTQRKLTPQGAIPVKREAPRG